MTKSSDDSIRDALNHFTEAARKLAHNAMGPEPAEHLKQSMRHAILAAASGLESMNHRMQSCRGTDKDEATHENQHPHQPTSNHH